MELHTERLILRDFTAADWPAVLAYQSDPRFLRYYPWTERTPDDAREFVGLLVRHQQEQPRIKFQLAITLKEDGRLIGNCGIRTDAPDETRGDLGYELGRDAWGQGYATEAAWRMVEYAFTELGLHRVWAWCIADNTASARVLEKLGMKQEGRLRDHDFFKGRWWDTLLYGTLESEWRNRVQVR